MGYWLPPKCLKSPQACLSFSTGLAANFSDKNNGEVFGMDNNHPYLIKVAVFIGVLFMVSAFQS